MHHADPTPLLDDHPTPSIEAAAAIAAARRLPLGFADHQHFARFVQALRDALATAGYADAVPSMQGAAVTGRQHAGDGTFDAGHPSAFDLALASPSALARAERLGVRLIDPGVRSGPLARADLIALDLHYALALLVGQAGRPLEVVLYRDLETARRRGPLLPLSIHGSAVAR